MQKSNFDLDSMLSLNDDEREHALSQLSDTEAVVLLYEWSFWARENQLIDLDEQWFIWLILTGRGWGKTRTGAETVRWVVEKEVAHRVALVAPTSADGRDVMVEGESGILSVSPPWFYPKYESSKRRLTWPNGAVATLYSSEEPERLRGPQHDFGWCDEVRAWANAEMTWDNLMLGLRLGKYPRVLVTTTPRMGMQLLRELVQRSMQDTPDVKITTGHMIENMENLAQPFLKTITKYEGTTLGRQELGGELLEYVEGALWSRRMIEQDRVEGIDPRTLDLVYVSVDPQTSGRGKSENAETGVLVCGIKQYEVEGNIEIHGYVIADLSSNASPNEWGRTVVDAYKKYRASAVIAEVNQGGAMVANTITNIDETVNVTDVVAVHSKRARAEPLANLYEKGRIHHVGEFTELEDQMCTWTPSERSPDRLDALVWNFTALIFENVSYGDVEDIVIEGIIPSSIEDSIRQHNPRGDEDAKVVEAESYAGDEAMVIGPEQSISERMSHVNGYIVVAHERE